MLISSSRVQHVARMCCSGCDMGSTPGVPPYLRHGVPRLITGIDPLMSFGYHPTVTLQLSQVVRLEDDGCVPLAACRIKNGADPDTSHDEERVDGRHGSGRVSVQCPAAIVLEI